MPLTATEARIIEWICLAKGDSRSSVADARLSLEGAHSVEVGRLYYLFGMSDVMLDLFRSNSRRHVMIPQFHELQTGTAQKRGEILD